MNYDPIQYTASSGASVDTPTPPILVSPTGSTSSSTPIFTWNSVANSTIYTVRVYDSAGVSLLFRGVNPAEVNCSSGGVCTYTGLNLADGVYTWKVKSNAGGDYSPVKNFTVGTVDTVGLPNITSPTSGSTLSSATQTFTWNSNGNDAIGWSLLVGSTSGGNDLASQWVAGSESSYTLGDLPVDGRTIYVTLAAQYADGWVNYDSIQYTASGGNSNSTAPEVPTVSSPTGNTSRTPSYRWNAVSGATSYLIGVENITNTNWQSVELTSVQASCAGSGTCSYRPSTSDMTLTTGDSYIWWVKAKNSVGESGWSSGLNFTVTQ